MGEMKRFWVDFVEGRISVPAMLARTKEQPELLDWLTSIADPKFETCVVQVDIDEDGYKTYTPIWYPFDASLQIVAYIHNAHGHSTLGRYLNIHGCFSKVMTTAFPDDGIVVDKNS